MNNNAIIIISRILIVVVIIIIISITFINIIKVMIMIFSNYLMRLSMICVILEILRKSKPMVVLSFIQNNCYFKTRFPRSMSSSRLHHLVPRQIQDMKSCLVI